MKMKKKNHDSDSKGKQANPPAESPHRELVTLWSSSKETVRVPAPPGRSRTANLSAEGEGKRLHAGLQELDLELSIGNRIQLSDELIHPRFRHGAVALVVSTSMPCPSPGGWPCRRSQRRTPRRGTKPVANSIANGLGPERATFSRSCSSSGLKMRKPRRPREIVTYHYCALVAAL